MEQSRFFPLLGFLLVAALCASLLLPIGVAFEEPCSECEAVGTVTCRTCAGSGKCWICGGTGEIWYMPENSDWCAACRGSGICRICGGVGWLRCEECLGTRVYWKFTSVGSAISLSILGIFVFLGFFALDFAVSVIYLEANPWVYDVRHMDFWLNPSFHTWLFAKDRRRWLKFQIPFISITSMLFGALLFLVAFHKRLVEASLSSGFLSSILFITVFSFIFFKSYVSRIED